MSRDVLTVREEASPANPPFSVSPEHIIIEQVLIIKLKYFSMYKGIRYKGM